jgi:hypothetical protein
MNTCDSDRSRYRLDATVVRQFRKSCIMITSLALSKVIEIVIGLNAGAVSVVVFRMIICFLLSWLKGAVFECVSFSIKQQHTITF